MKTAKLFAEDRKILESRLPYDQVPWDSSTRCDKLAERSDSHQPTTGDVYFGRFPSGTVVAIDTALHAMTRRQQLQQLPTHAKLGNPSVS